jgi:hypothetical protein
MSRNRLGIGLQPEEPSPKKRIGYGFHIDTETLKRVSAAVIFLAMLALAFYVLFTSFEH